MPRLRHLVPLVVALAGCVQPGAAAGAKSPPLPLVLATATRVKATGLLDALLPGFEQQAHVRVRVIAVGSDEALAMGRRGEADVLLVQSKAAEDAFMADGQGFARFDVMRDGFRSMGPAGDPARVQGDELPDTYRVIVLDPAKHPQVHVREAWTFAKWLVSPNIQRRIGEFGAAQHGRPFFVPAAK